MESTGVTGAVQIVLTCLDHFSSHAPCRAKNNRWGKSCIMLQYAAYAWNCMKSCIYMMNYDEL